MTLAIMLLWIVGISLLIAVAVKRGRTISKKTKSFAPLDTAAAATLLEAVHASVAKRNDATANLSASVWVKHVGPRELVRPGKVVMRSDATVAANHVKAGKPSRPAKIEPF